MHDTTGISRTGVGAGRLRSQLGVRGALRPGNMSLYQGAGWVFGKPAPSSMCGALTAMYAKYGLRWAGGVACTARIHSSDLLAITDVE